MNTEQLKEIWKQEEAVAHIHGWDFSHIHGRYEEEEPWDFREIIQKYRTDRMKLLDMETGGGEFLLSLRHPNKNTAAFEAYPPSVKLCREVLLPLEIDFKEAEGAGRFPFADESFDMVTNRHGDCNAADSFLCYEVDLPTNLEDETMLKLIEVNEENWLAFRNLSIREEQKGFLDSPLGILARGYVYRNDRARVIGIAEDDTVIGVALVRDLDDEPACYDLQQFMVDARFQGKGCGTAALRMILSELEQERKYDCVEVCVKKTDAAALRVYEKAGFVDTGYIDEDAPDSLNLMYHFSDH